MNKKEPLTKEQAIMQLDYRKDFATKDQIIALDMGIEALRQKPEWIPVDQDKYPEGYPKPFQEVWVTDDYGEVVHCCYGGQWKIKAWMPYIVPEPYKESGEKE